MKKFLIIGNSNAITYKSIFPYIASGEWFLRTGKGDRHCSMYFLDEDGERKDMPSLWYTNLDSRHLYQELELTEKYDPEKYPKYDNFDGIEVSKLRDIPCDYSGVMGVPISVVLFSPEQFEIVGDTNPLARGGLINGKYTYKRVPVRLRKKKDKKFLILGNGNAVTTKDIFPLIKDNKMWLGTFYGSMEFIISADKFDETKCSKYRVEDGEYYIKLMMITWYTNMEHKKKSEPLVLTKKYNSDDYKQYDNYSAINVDKVKDIPCDYDGEIGVPITFLKSYNPNQFEIIGVFNNSKLEEKAENGYVLSTNTLTIRKNGQRITNEPVINKKSKYKRLVIKKINKNLDF